MNNETTNNTYKEEYNNIFNSLSNWMPLNKPCPKCGSVNTEYNSSMVLTSMPPQYGCRCTDCQHTFNTYDYDVPSTCPTPSYGGLRQGWICPKCGRALSPDLNTCPYCDGHSNIVYCTTNTIVDVLDSNLKDIESTRCANGDCLNNVLS